MKQRIRKAANGWNQPIGTQALRLARRDNDKINQSQLCGGKRVEVLFADGGFLNTDCTGGADRFGGTDRTEEFEWSGFMRDRVSANLFQTRTT